VLVHNVPNLITLMRVLLVPLMAACVLGEAYGAATAVFLVAALSDLVDGYLARRFNLVSRLGAVLDPIADKLNMFVATVLLAWQGLLPMWLAAAIVGRDVAIVAGVLWYRVAGKELAMKPSLLSKANTAIEFAVLLLVLAAAARLIERGSWMSTLFVVVLIFVIASWAHYAWLWSRGALVARRVP
jgi:cardiolipin synthase